MSRILIVEDNTDIATALAENLLAGGHTVAIAPTGDLALRQVEQHQPDLILLDLMLPDRTGESVLQAIRAAGCATPVLILSAKSDEMTKVHGFRIGADDYVTKPFGLLELLARIENLLRRRGGSAPAVVRFGRIEVRPSARRVLLDGSDVPLRPKEMDLLLALLDQPNQAVSRRTLLEQVWRYDATVESRTVDWHMAELRRKLEADPENPTFLHTVRKVGYRIDIGIKAA
jgi:two-component system response regulator MtrA